MTVRVQEQAFDLGAEVQGFALGRDDAGAVVSFTGIVRNTPDGDLERMEMEHYPGMTENALKGIEAEAMKRWNLKGCLIIHRYGTLRPGDLIMMVATASPHRGDAFEAAMFLMDYLKSRAPFWKKEFTTDGAEWVAAKDEDEDALTKW
ncbi:molybdenum cofactor biosynthesis protein MoaE [Profundibacter amoris]|uniref:Molybdopterin synthase catalytic subunit n=1 Tax=Profundibacter amoris TaxID=2171755 RepID=A0A347UK08_9RHOB|nr:molybdenum cofactor biosynthesis protein MoaE [Profundibacter amoris]AXX99186.1 molybdenum cofactor biosynthesis protein MoaE [Profundibacter amoris]